MGQVLAKGGFAAEAVPPVRDAVELSVRALALLAGIDAAGDGDGAPPDRGGHPDRGEGERPLRA
jgi:hypothetical protein